ncbi:hypothetical protein HMPREF1494_2208 [Bifidobacterium sp. MSTE12]|nr:hypothetical protein HMPREF1494_2208 [Bifidobacterium sp. MSTE12]
MAYSARALQREPRRNPDSAAPSERRLRRGSRRSPRIMLRCVEHRARRPPALHRTRRRPRPEAARARGLRLVAGDLRACAAQGGADLVDLQLNDRAALALLGVVRALGEATLNDDAHALTQRLGDVLSGLAPHGAAHEEGVAVAPLTGVTVVGSRGRCDGEVCDGGAGLRPTQFGVSGQVTDDSDDGFSSHYLLSFFSVSAYTSTRTSYIGRFKCFPARRSAITVCGPSRNRSESSGRSPASISPSMSAFTVGARLLRSRRRRSGYANSISTRACCNPRRATPAPSRPSK